MKLQLKLKIMKKKSKKKQNRNGENDKFLFISIYKRATIEGILERYQQIKIRFVTNCNMNKCIILATIILSHNQPKALTRRK